MPRAFIAGTGFYVPPRVVTNQDLVDHYKIDTTHEWIVQRSGIEARRFADEGVSCSDLAVPAAKDAVERAGLQLSDIDLIVFATLSPEHAFPGSGVYLQSKLGLVGIPALDVRNQCSGFLYALSCATAHVQAGMAKNVLVVGAETHSPGMDLTTRGRQVACLFGDGAGAVVVRATEEDRGVRWMNLGADGNFANVLYQRVWDAKKRPYIKVNENGEGVIPTEDMWPIMDGKVVFKNAVEKMIMSVVGMCMENKIETKDLDLVVCHQANLRINQFVAEQLQLPPEKVPNNIQKYGNTTAATIPILLAELERDGRLQRGMNVALVAFGSGFTWGSALLKW